MTPTLSILLVGDADRSEFRHARAAMDRIARVTAAADAEAAAAMLAEGRAAADVIVVAQAYPGKFSHEAIDRLRRLAPLARVLGLLGSWCEGEMRTGHPWPAAIRIYWHQWEQRWGQEAARLMRGECPAWGLPVTATDEERLLLAGSAPPQHREGLIAIHAPSFELADWLSAACRSRGYATAWLRAPHPRRLEGAKAAIFDGSDLQGFDADELRRLAAALSPAPVIVLLDFPRSEDCDCARAAGAAAVLSKPLLLDDLFWQLDRPLATS